MLSSTVSSSRSTRADHRNQEDAMPRSTLALVVSMLALGAATVAADGQPWPTFAVESRVRVKVGDIRVADVVSVEGNLFTTAVLTFREGGETDVVRKLPGPTMPGDVIIRRAVRTDDVLWEWYQQTLAGNLLRKDVTILYLGATGLPVVRFDLLRCFPSAYALHAGTTVVSTVSVEAVTIACEGATRSQQ
jgi:phage tail-like protein